jgi:hypothetical protein
MTASAALTNPESAARSLLQMVLAHLSPRREFAVQLWDGEQWPPESNSPAGFKLIFRTPNVVRSMFGDVSSLSSAKRIFMGTWTSRVLSSIYSNPAIGC